MARIFITLQQDPDHYWKGKRFLLLSQDENATGGNWFGKGCQRVKLGTLKNAGVGRELPEGEWEEVAAAGIECGDAELQPEPVR